MALQFLAGNPLFWFRAQFETPAPFPVGHGGITSHEHFTTTHSFL